MENGIEMGIFLDKKINIFRLYDNFCEGLLNCDKLSIFVYKKS